MKTTPILLLLLTTLLSLNHRLYAQADNKDSVYTISEEPPSFIGGDEARIKFIIDNIKYPDLAREKGISGTVFVTFVVEQDGSLSNVKILRGIGGGCDEEVIRIIKLMPKWKPGYQDGKAVKVQFNMPIKFTLVGKQKKKKEKRKRKTK